MHTPSNNNEMENSNVSSYKPCVVCGIKDSTVSPMEISLFGVKKTWNFCLEHKMEWSNNEVRPFPYGKMENDMEESKWVKYSIECSSVDDDGVGGMLQALIKEHSNGLVQRLEMDKSKIERMVTLELQGYDLMDIIDLLLEYYKEA